LNYECDKCRLATGRILDEYREIFWELELADLDPSILNTHHSAIDKANKIRINSLWKLKRFDEVVIACTQAMEIFLAGNFLLTRAWANLKLGNIHQAWFDVRKLVDIDKDNGEVCDLICVLEGVPMSKMKSQATLESPTFQAQLRRPSLLDRVRAEIKRESDMATEATGGTEPVKQELKIEEVSSALRRIRHISSVEVKLEDDDTSLSSCEETTSESDPQVWAIRSQKNFEVKSESD
jgi:hypothetical protein